MLKDAQAFSSFSVADIPAAREFYGTTLGLEVSDENGMLRLHTAGNVPILVYPKQNHTPATFTVLNLVVDNIEQIVDELTGRGISFEQYTSTDAKGIATIDGMSIRQSWFKDPSGNFVSLIEQQK